MLNSAGNSSRFFRIFARGTLSLKTSMNLRRMSMPSPVTLDTTKMGKIISSAFLAMNCASSSLCTTSAAKSSKEAHTRLILWTMRLLCKGVHWSEWVSTMLNSWAMPAETVSRSSKPCESSRIECTRKK